MANYNRQPITELDSRQCVYTAYDETGCSNLVVNGETVIDIMERKMGKNITKAEAELLTKYPDREAYRWVNLRGTTIVFRTGVNENMFHFEKLQKLQ